jgi:hypothetical protein
LSWFGHFGDGFTKRWRSIEVGTTATTATGACSWSADLG